MPAVYVGNRFDQRWRCKFKHKQTYDVVRFHRWLSKKKELVRLLRPIYFSCLLLFVFDL